MTYVLIKKKLLIVRALALLALIFDISIFIRLNMENYQAITIKLTFARMIVPMHSTDNIFFM